MVPESRNLIHRYEIRNYEQNRSFWFPRKLLAERIQPYVMGLGIGKSKGKGIGEQGIRNKIKLVPALYSCWKFWNMRTVGVGCTTTN